jgi:D-amino-acid dehydrogenase
MIGSLAGMFVGNGLGSSGLAIGPYAGKLLAQLVLHGKAEIDLAPYDPALVAASEADPNAYRND